MSVDAPVALGLGCDRGTSAQTLQEAVDQALHRLSLPPTQVVVLASIDIKSDEPCMHALAQKLGVPLRWYPAVTLAAVPVPNPSATVLRHTGTPSVSEAAALLAAGEAEERPAQVSALCLEKHRWRGADGKHATVSVARMSVRNPSSPLS